MQKSHAQHASAADQSTFLIHNDSIRSSIKAASWDEAMSRAYQYIRNHSKPKTGSWLQWISYTVYLLPEDVYIDPEGDEYLEILEDCKSQDASYLGEEA